MTFKNFVIVIGSILAAIGSALLFIFLGGKRPSEVVVTDKTDDKPPEVIVEEAVEKVQEIQAKPDEKIIEEHVTEVQKEKVETIVDAQVSKAMASASKYKRKKT